MLKTIDRALELLGAFTVERPEWGVTELALRQGWDKSIVQRVLATLEARDYVMQSQETKKYRLGFAILGLADVVDKTLDVREVARASVHGLVEATGESVILTVRSGNEAVCVDALDGPRAIKYSTRVGMRIPPHVGAGSKVLFAFRPTEELAAMLSGRALEAFTESTITEEAELLEEYERIRQRGIAVSLGERDPEVAAIGCPVRDHRGEVVAAITVVGPKERIVGGQRFLEEKVMAAARESSARLSVQGSLSTGGRAGA